MEHLDLAGVITTPSNWMIPTFDSQDAIYLSNSRQMLEPIMEETSEDEEHAQNSWNQYDQTHNSSFWSSAESETGSVIRIEVNRDPDSISERDFACPAKRARRSDEFLFTGATNIQSQQQQNLQVPNSLDDTVLLRRYQRNYPLEQSDTNNSLDRFLAFEASCRDSLGSASQQRSSTGSRRFDDFFSDSDSLSYQSLSRSSSLIQFESLERQLLLQEQHVSMSSLGASSPSLLNYDGANSTTNNMEDTGMRSGGNSGSNSGNNSRRGSQSSLLKRFESADGRLHQTYFELDKLNFEDEERLLFGASKSNIVEMTIGEVKSDSESSTTSSGNSILTTSKPSAEDLTDSMISMKTSRSSNASSIFQRGGKNSVENLSEDSGYCEPSTLRRAKSKSIPKNFEKFCEEEEEFHQYEQNGGEESVYDQNTIVQHSKNSNLLPEQKYDHHNYRQQHHDYHLYDYPESEMSKDGMFQPKINDTTFIVESSEETTAQQFDVDYECALIPPDSQIPSSISSSSSSSKGGEGYERVKNSPQRELHELRRSMAHSPSPVSSESSSGSSQCSRNTRSSSTTSSSASVSTCASAASFTWLPPQMQSSNKHARVPQQQQQQQQQYNNNNHLHHFQPTQRLEPKQTLGDFYANSLPDIRDASSSETYLPTYEQQHRTDLNNINGYGLDLSKVNPDDSDSISTASPIGCYSRSDAATTDTESTPESTKRQITIVDGVGSGSGCGLSIYDIVPIKGRRSSGARISSEPNEIYKLGRKNRSKASAKKSKYQKKFANSGEVSNNSTEYISSSTDESDEEEEYDEDINSCVKIRRSCSWSERREKNDLQKFDQIDNVKPFETQLLGFMNASYHNLTLLDYSGKRANTNKANLKRSGAQNIENIPKNMDSRKCSGDYDDFAICKGNFLLDELSEIYDKNASILNDEPLDQPIGVVINAKLETPINVSGGSSPKVPPRQRKNSNSSYSDVDGGDQEIQHVQLTIRKPPTRHRNGRKGENTNSLISELSPPTFGTFGKTFDQDPTCLRTSYAQSLEKCNFDAKEVSNSDLTKVRPLPKRRFHSQAATAKKKNLVSSTPNLNAFDPNNDEIEDDIYVSSAHTSMSKLPQSSGQKPLGILLPTGSRSSFGKEVSFCPVVSKYSWQEQSSEELNEPSTPQTDGHVEEESDDELLDNADATVIHNTKENEMIAARYKEENDKRTNNEVKESETSPCDERENLRETTEQRETEEFAENKTSHEVVAANKLVSSDSDNQAAAQSANECGVSLKTTIVDIATTTTTATAKKRTKTKHESFEPDIQNACTTEFNTKEATSKNGQEASHIPNETKSRPFSIQLPILSEPPTNRAHILYASQHLIDNLQRREREEEEEQRQRAFSENINYNFNKNSNQKVQSVQNNFNKMPKKSGKSNEFDAVGISNAQQPVLNNNNETMKSKFKADEKHPNSKGFLSRFANGFRFSLRRNKKKHQQLQQQKELQQQQQQLAEQASKVAAANGQNKRSGNNENSPDFIYIPLKGPLTSAGSRNANSSTITTTTTTTKSIINSNATSNDSGCSVQDSNVSTASTIDSINFAKVGAKIAGKQQSQQEQQHHVPAKVTGKPPRQPPPPPVRAGSGITVNNNQSVAGANDLQSASQHAQYQANILSTANNFTHYQPQQQHFQQQSPNQFYNDFLDAERSYYYEDFKNQLNSGMQANGYTAASASPVSVSASVSGSGSGQQQHSSPVALPEFSSPSRASVSQKTQMFNNLNLQGGKNSVYNQKIGLIETNLDTHETVISGKARSLINIGPQTLSSVKRLTTAGGINIDDDDDDGVDVYDGDDEEVVTNKDGNVVVVVKKKGNHSAGGGGQIASVRRPHKSMEFLLDKENQRNVLVRDLKT